MNGKCLGEYEILDPLGEGGMGAVFRARHQRLGREVAVKVLRPGAVENVEHQHRFQREMTLAAGLSHPNLVKILDGGTIDGTAFIAMELVSGETITSVVTQWAPLPWSIALAIGSRVADGLAFLHERAILHRDVKPSNVLVSREGYVKLLDFGLARGHGATVMTQEGAVVGTLQFLSPELLTGDDASPGSDLWAVGCILYLMLTGRMHVMAADFNDWVQAIVNDPIRPPGALLPTIPAPASQLVSRLLSRDVKQRPSSAARLRDELDRILWEVGQTSWDRVLVPGVLEAVERGTYRDPLPADQRTAAVGGEVQAAPKLHGSQRVPRPRSGANAPVTRPHSRGGVAAPLRAPSAPGARRRVLAAALPVVIAAAVASAYLLRPLAVPPRPVPPTASAAPAPALPSDALSAYARHLTGFLPRLKAGGETAKAAVAEIRNKKPPLDLGKAADNWVKWIELEQWLEGGGHGDPPRSATSTDGLMNAFDLRVVNGYISGLGNDLTPTLVMAGIRGVGGTPDDGRCWLVLGRALELEGRLREAGIAYAAALERLRGLNGDDTQEVIWIGLGRALIKVPGHQLEREWYAYLPEYECHRAWNSLRRALKGEDSERYQKVLRAGFHEKLSAEKTLTLLDQTLSWAKEDPARARALWIGELTSQPASQVTMVALNWLCVRGELDAARELAERVHVAIYAPIIDYLGGGPARGPLPWQSYANQEAARALLLKLEAFRQLELARVTDAEDCVDAATGEGKKLVLELAPVLVELVGQGTTRGWVEPAVKGLLSSDPPDLAVWNDAAGALCTPQGLHLMEKQVVRGGSAQDQPESWREVMRAVWLARRGKHLAALEALAHGRDLYGKEMMPGTEVAEVLSRPALAQQLGHPVESGAVARAAAFALPPGLSGTSISEYLDALHEQRLDAAADLARRHFTSAPTQLYWGLAAALHARIAGRPDQLAAARAKLEAAVRWRSCGLWALAEAAAK